MQRKLTTIHDPAWQVDIYAEQNSLDYDPDLTPTMVWVDTETTGLSRKGEDRTLELAIILTDDDGILVDAWQSFVTGMDWPQVMKDMNDFVHDMHTHSGFLNEREKYLTDPDMPAFHSDTVSDEALTFLEGWRLLREPNTYEMCGSTVGFDRKMLQQDMPPLENWFHHRNIDVSTLKQLCKKHNPRIAEHWAAQKPAIKPHRALLDIAVSVREYRYYVQNFLWVTK